MHVFAVIKENDLRSENTTAGNRIVDGFRRRVD
jgi:hypothetical protein